MAWRATQYYDVEKGAAFPLAAPIYAENKATAESYDRLFSSNPNRYYIWNVDSQGEESPPPILPPGPVIYSTEEYNPPAYAAPTPPPPIWGFQPVEDPVYAAPTPPPPVWGVEPPPAAVVPVIQLEDSITAGSPRLDPVAIMDYPVASSPNPPVGPRIIEFPSIDAPTRQPDDYQPLEAFPIPSTPTVYVPPVPPDIGLNPREWFPAERRGPLLFSTPIGDDGHVAPFNPIAVLFGDLVQSPTKPAPAPIVDPVPAAPSVPILSWTEDTWQKYRDDIARLEQLADEVPATPTPPIEDTMATNRYQLAGTPAPGEQTVIPDTNALLKQALDTVGTLANIFVPSTSSAPSPTAAPTPQPAPAPWYQAIPTWAWLIVAGVVGVLVLRRS